MLSLFEMMTCRGSLWDRLRTCRLGVVSTTGVSVVRGVAGKGVAAEGPELSVGDAELGDASSLLEL